VELGIVQGRLSRIQRLAALCITGAMRTTPTAALETLLNLPPLDMVVRVEAMAACRRLKMAGQWRRLGLTGGHTGIGDTMREIPELSLPSWDRIMPSFQFDKKFSARFPSREDWSQKKLGLPEGPVCYTDGSHMGGYSGAGVYLGPWGDNIVVPLGQFATVFQAEVYAIGACAKAMDQYQDLSISICSDSEAALKALMAPRVTSALVRECQQVLDQLGQHNAVQLIWVPGHAGVEGNEYSDQLARQASQSRVYGPEPIIPLSSRLGQVALQEWARRQHWGLWEAHPGCRQAKELLGGHVDPRKSGQLLRLRRKDLRLVVGVLTGHNTLRRHLSILGVEPSPYCVVCRVEETSYHFLCRCVRFAALRWRIWGADPLEVADIQRAKVGDLLRFIRGTGRFPALD